MLIPALLLVSAGRACGDDRSLVILFGPIPQDAGRQAVHFVAETTHDWLKTQGATVELRRSKVAEGQELTGHMQPKDLEQALTDAAASGGQIDLQGFLNDLDRAAYALARRPGKRVLLVILESPSPETVKAMGGGTDEFESRINQTVDFCRSKTEAVAVFDPSLTATQEPMAALKSLTSATGGTLVREAKLLASSLLVISPLEKAESVASPPAAVAREGLPVRTRFFRVLPIRAENPSTDLGPMTGLVLAECPISALQSRTDGGKFIIQARVTEILRNADGKNVWEAKKDFTIKEPLKKLDARKGGNLYLVRRLQVPGGQYAMETSVDDVIAEKSGKASETLHATDSLPGLAVSDAMFVRPLNESADRLEGDEILAYNGVALAPLLDPVFMANEPFTLRLYFVIYPDTRGAQPEMSMEIVHDGRAVGRSQLGFNDLIRNLAGENGTMGGKSEQKHEFPYMTEIRDATFGEGQYEARVTVRQGRNTVTRSTPFRIVRSSGN